MWWRKKSSSMSDRLGLIIKRLYQNKDYIPTEAAFHFAVITAMIGWNQANGFTDDTERQKERLEKDWPEYRKYLKDFKKGDFYDLISLAEAIKKELYPDDRRQIVRAGYVDGNLRVEHMSGQSQI